MEQLFFKEREIPIPKVKKNEVLIKVKSVGVCGTDVHLWKHGKIGSCIIKKPIILGHEFSGEIVNCGRNVSKLSIGDLVVVEPGEPCGKCEYCRKGRYNLCPEMKFFADPPHDGALREYVTFDASFVYRVPAGISSEVATLVEPMAVGTFSTKKVNISLGDKVIIYGSGVIGLCCLISALASGASEIAIVDIREERLHFAKKIGADIILNSSKDSLNEYSSYFDVVYECTGASDCLIDASKRLKMGGKIAAIGVNISSTQEAPITEMIFKEQHFIPIFRYANVFHIAIDTIFKNIETIKKFITHRFSFNDVEKAFITATDDKNALKVIINF